MAAGDPTTRMSERYPLEPPSGKDRPRRRDSSASRAAAYARGALMDTFYGRKSYGVADGFAEVEEYLRYEWAGDGGEAVARGWFTREELEAAIRDTYEQWRGMPRYRGFYR